MGHKLNTVINEHARGNFQAAIDAFATIRKVPSSEVARLHTTVAQCHFRLGTLDLAAHHFQKAADASPTRKIQLPLYEVAFELHRKADAIPAALRAAEHVLAIDPRHKKAAMFRRHHLFDSLALDALKASNAAVLTGIEAGDEFALSCELPFNVIHWCSDERISAKIFGEGQNRFSEAARVARRDQPHAFGDRIRVGYLSNDVSSAHATMILLRGVLDEHDRTAFDITLYCYTDSELTSRDDGFRTRFDTIVEIGDLTDQAAAERIRDDSIDILVDLKGHTKSARIDLVNLGPAPVQVAWLGFPGSGTGIDCDYIIGDPIVTPETSKLYYHETFCRLPESYQPNDHRHRPLPPPARRGDLFLPDGKIVFASFNSIKKISPEAFSAWVRILRAVPESVLWIMCPKELPRGNLLALARQHGIAETRIIFADPVGYALHIARLQAADIVLDTFPCCGHTTTSDCLWAGVPIVSLKGRNFASRVSESLLTALGAPELVADDVDHYVTLAVAMADDPTLLANTRRKLDAHRFLYPLFDTERFTRHLETAYAMMVERAKAGLDPAPLDVPALPMRDRPFR